MKEEKAICIIKSIFEEDFYNLSQWNRLFIITTVKKHNKKRKAKEWLRDFKNHMIELGEIK